MKDALGNVLVGRTVAWSSGNTAVATISTAASSRRLHRGAQRSPRQAKESQVRPRSPCRRSRSDRSWWRQPVRRCSLVRRRPLSADSENVAGAIVTDRVVTWTTSAASVATVSQTGSVTAVGRGNRDNHRDERGKKRIVGPDGHATTS